MKKINLKKHKLAVKKNDFYVRVISISVFLFYFIVALFAICVFDGCVKYVDREVPVPYEVNVPVPMKCKFELHTPPRVDTSNLQKLLDSSTAILKYDAELYNAIKKVPCLDVER